MSQGAYSYAAAASNNKQYQLRIPKFALDLLRTKDPNFPDHIDGLPRNKEELAKCGKDTWYGLRASHQFKSAAALMHVERGYVPVALAHFKSFAVINGDSTTGPLIIMRGFDRDPKKDVALANLQKAFNKPMTPQNVNIPGPFGTSTTVADSLMNKFVLQRVGIDIPVGLAPAAGKQEPFGYLGEYKPSDYARFALMPMPYSPDDFDRFAEHVPPADQQNAAFMPYEYLATSVKHDTMAAINIRKEHNAWTVAKQLLGRFRYVYVKSCAKILVQDDGLNSDDFVKDRIKDIAAVANAYRLKTETTYIWPLAGDDGKTPALIFKSIDGSPILPDIIKALADANVVKFVGEPLCRSHNTWLIRTDNECAERFDGFLINNFYILSRPGAKGGPAPAAAPGGA